MPDVPILVSGTLARMGKQIGHPPRRLSVVGSKEDSAADASAPANQEDSRAAKRKAQLDAAREKAIVARRKQVAGVRERRAAGEKTPLEKFRAGEYPISEWSDEEVFKGKPRAMDGTFSGAMPRFTGREHQQIKAELLKRGQRKMDGMFAEVVDVLHKVALYGETESARVKAAQILMERVAGKVPDKIEIKSSDPWQDILDEIMDDEVLQRMNETTEAAD